MKKAPVKTTVGKGGRRGTFFALDKSLNIS